MYKSYQLHEIDLVKKHSEAWYNHLKHGHPLPASLLARVRPHPFWHLSNAEADPNPFKKNPTNADADDKYQKKADAETKALDEKHGDKRAPMSLFEGLQTTVNLARVSADFEPLDQPKQKGQQAKGDSAHFIQFVDNINTAPFLTLDFGGTKSIKQTSTNANDIIDSFIKAFEGMQTQSLDKIKKSIGQLIDAALSYSRTEESESNFTQNILKDLEANADGTPQIGFSLYSSVFSIYTEKSKGTIKFVSEYEVSQAQWTLDQYQWENFAQEVLAEEQRTATKDWFQKMKTKPDGSSKNLPSCFADQK